MAAPSARGTRWRFIDETSGPATAAMMVATTSGTKITWVSESSQATPDEQHDDADQQPRRDPGVAKPFRGREDARELAEVQLDELVGAARPARRRPPATEAATDHGPVPFMMGS